ncbi:hypothetical protein [Streptomyces sp. NPDC005476]|uniref:hypothetical protein n=1 Tax=Streptomyces sp. NPDC005476 TaxID=3156882 RepID=UPI003452AE7A
MPAAAPAPSVSVPRPDAWAEPVPGDAGATGAGVPAGDGGRAGRLRRCTGADIDLVSGAGPDPVAGLAGDTRMPRAGKAAGADGAVGREAVTGTARVAGADGTNEDAGGADAVEWAAAAGPADCGTAPAATGPGAAGRGPDTGDVMGDAGTARWSGVGRGGADTRSGSAAGGAARRLLIAPPGAASSTAWKPVPVKEGFCQVASRPPNPASATPEVPPAAARWMGGSVGQAAATTRGTEPEPLTGAEAEGAAGAAAEGAVEAGPAADAEAGPAVDGDPGGDASGPLPRPPSSPRRPRSRSRNPMPQPSAPPRVTREAIWSA